MKLKKLLYNKKKQKIRVGYLEYLATPQPKFVDYSKQANSDSR